MYFANWLGHVAALAAVEWRNYGLGIPPQYQTRTAQAELLQVRRGVFRGSARLSCRKGCQRPVVHGGVHPRYGTLQPDIFGEGRGGQCGCGTGLWSAFAATRGKRCGSGGGVHRGWAAGAVSDGCVLFQSRYPARNATSGCERTRSAARTCQTSEAAARASPCVCQPLEARRCSGSLAAV